MPKPDGRMGQKKANLEKVDIRLEARSIEFISTRLLGLDSSTPRV
jgi:hypothetical protein